MIEAAHRFEGCVVAQCTGDGIFALFGAAIDCRAPPERKILRAARDDQPRAIVAQHRPPK
jgi:hypothetical protein